MRCYENGDPYLGDATDVEARAGWGGREGALVAALVEAGGPGHAGFIEEGGSPWWPDGEPRTYRVHDLFDHAPRYVKRRVHLEAIRQADGRTISELRAEAGRKGGKQTASKRAASGQQTGSKLLPGSDNGAANGQQTVATPAPAPAHSREEALPSATPPAAADEEASKASMLAAVYQKNRVPGLAFLMAGIFEEVRGEKYAHGGAKDTKALGRLVKIADNAEIMARWRRALALGSKWPGCSTFAQLASKWNDLGAPAGGNGIRAPELLDLRGIDDDGRTIYGQGTP